MDSPKTAQDTINERLNFLIKQLGLSVRAFSNTLDVPDTNTRNYLTKGTKLNSDYLDRIARHFKQVNLAWLITGNGAPLTLASGETGEPGTAYQKNNPGNSVGVSHGTTTQTQSHGSSGSNDCEKQLKAAQEEISRLKDRIIQLLESQIK